MCISKIYKRFRFFSKNELKKDKILEHENFDRTFAGIGLTNILDLEKRSSWTHKLKFHFNLIQHKKLTTQQFFIL